LDSGVVFSVFSDPAKGGIWPHYYFAFLSLLPRFSILEEYLLEECSGIGWNVRFSLVFGAAAVANGN
jgi:hypothetical protein